MNEQAASANISLLLWRLQQKVLAEVEAVKIAVFSFGDHTPVLPVRKHVGTPALERQALLWWLRSSSGQPVKQEAMNTCAPCVWNRPHPEQNYMEFQG